MKCKLCGQPAVAKTVEGLRLCKEHFLEYVLNRVRRAIRRFHMIMPGDKVAVMISGGKDSGVLLDVLFRLKEEYSITLLPVYIDLGIKGYSEESKKTAILQTKKLGLELEIYDLEKEDGFTIDLVSRLRRMPPCAACGIVKRHVMEIISRKHGNAIIATGHNLTDMFVFLEKNMMTGNFEMLRRYSASLPEEHGFSKKIKPLVLVPESATLLYAFYREIPYVTLQCPHGENAVNTRLRMALFRVERVLPTGPYNAVTMMLRDIVPRLGTPEKKITKCSVCGLPASGDPCSFCRLKRKIHEKIKS